MSTTPRSTAVRLSVMMFLQFFVWGAWFATLGLCLGSNGLGDFSGGAYGSAPLGAMIAPLFLGLIADRFFPSEKVFGVLFLIGGALLLMIPNVAADGNGQMMVWLMFGNMLCFMPSLGLANTIVFTNVDHLTFPKVRVWGTIGWIIAGLVVGILGWSAKFDMFYIAGIASLILGIYAFFLPHTPAPSKGQPVNMRALFMVDAFSLLKRPAFFVFMLCSMLICIPLAYYYGVTSNYLQNTGFLQPASTMTIGQMSEIFFMLLIPFFFRKLGVKWMILLGMLGWVLRYVLFAYGAPDQVVWMIFLGVALHGICYDFFFVTGFMYTDKEADPSIRSQAQSMLVFFTQGLGMYIGYAIVFGILYQVPSSLFGIKVDFSSLGDGVLGFTPLETAIKESRAGGDISFLQQLGQMFSVSMPEGVKDVVITDPSEVKGAEENLLFVTMNQWKSYWLLPAGMAGAIAALFFVAFRDKKKSATDGE
jgi:nucleoside transporter